MSEMLHGQLAFSTLARIFFFAGFFSSLILFPIYTFIHWHELSPLAWAALLFISPISNGLVCVLLLALIFPLYKYFIKLDRFNLNEIKIHK